MQLLEISKLLQELGLSNKQARVYVAGLFLGPASAQHLAEQAEINRPTTYVILNELIGLGLASQSALDKRTLFTMADPTAVTRLLQEERELLNQREQTLQSLLPELRQITRDTSAHAPVVRFVRGKQGVESIMAEAVRKTRRKSTIYSITNHDEVRKIFPDILITNPPVRLSKQLYSKQFYSYKDGVIPSDARILKETKKVDFPVAASLTFYESIALLMSYGSDEKQWSGIVIENPGIVQALRQLFELAWEKSENSQTDTQK